jgi:hypothetical protein
MASPVRPQPGRPSRMVTPRPFLPGFIRNGWVSLLYDAGFQIIADCSDSCATEELVHVNVAVEPRRFFHVKTSLYIGILAVWQRGHK